MAKFWSWASCEFSVIKEGKPAVIMTEIASIGYGDALEQALVHGAGREPLGTTDAVYMPGELTITFLAKWFRVWSADVTNNGETKLGDHEFRLNVKRKSQSESVVINDVIDFVITGADDSGEGGSAEKLVTEVKGQCTMVKRNNVQL